MGENSDKPECVSAKGEFFEKILNPPGPDPSRFLREKKICDLAVNGTAIERCVQRETLICYNATAREICELDLTTMHNAITYSGSDNPTYEEKVAYWCPQIYNPDLRKGCPTFLKEYTNYIKWLDDYYGITLTTQEIDLYYMKMAFDYDKQYCGKISNPELRVNCPVWIKQYSNYDEWYFEYYEFTLCPSSPETNQTDLCYMQKAINNHQVGYCKYLTNPDLITGCPTWVQQYNNYDEWYKYYFETLINPPNP